MATVRDIFSARAVSSLKKALKALKKNTSEGVEDAFRSISMAKGYLEKVRKIDLFLNKEEK